METEVRFQIISNTFLRIFVSNFYQFDLYQRTHLILIFEGVICFFELVNSYSLQNNQ